MKRRDFLKQAGAGTVVAGAALASGCSKASDSTAAAPAIASGKKITWKMVTTWPMNFPGLGTGANHLAEKIGEMSGGRMTVKVYGAGELVPAFEVFDAVTTGTAEMGHGATYYWKGKDPALQYFAALPFGMTATEMNAWLLHGGGLELWAEAYDRFGLVPMAAGNSGVQMAGWFNKEINSVADLKGLKMRIPGLGGEALERAGGTPVNIPGGEIYTSMSQGIIDATEWVGPYNDLAFGLHKVAKHYYYPGWHEPGPTLECMVNQKAFNSLPDDLKAIVRAAASSTNESMLAEYNARNKDALAQLKNDHSISPQPLPTEVLENLRGYAAEIIDEMANSSPLATRIHKSYFDFYERAVQWSNISERAFLNTRPG